MKFLYVLPLLMIATPLAAAETEIVAEDAELKKLADGFQFTEGPAVDGEGNVFFTDQPNNRIMKYTTEGELVEWMKPSGRSNGLCFDAEGNLWACADEKNELWKISPDKEVTVVVEQHDGKLLNGPNDVWVHPSSAVYFSDPFYKRKWWTRGKSEQKRGVYYLSPDRKSLRRVAEGMAQPNGLIGTPDGKTLYVTDIGKKQTWAFTIADDGGLEDKQLFCEQGSDGLTIDDRGNIYLTGKGVDVYNPDGELIRHIDVPERWTANVCFGGKDRDTLFITASKGLYGLKMNVHGVNSQ